MNFSVPDKQRCQFAKLAEHEWEGHYSQSVVCWVNHTRTNVQLLKLFEVEGQRLSPVISNLVLT